MNKKRNPFECPTCEKTPCQCAGGGSKDEERSDKDDKNDVERQRKQRIVSQPVNFSLPVSQPALSDEESITTLSNKDDQLPYCMFFASTEDQQVSSELSNDLNENDLNEDDAENTENPAFGI